MKISERFQKIPGLRRFARRPEPAEEGPVATQYIIRTSRGDVLSLESALDRTAQAMESTSVDEKLKAVRQMADIARVTQSTPEEAARISSILLYQATGIKTGILRRMEAEALAVQEEALETQRKAERYRGVRGRFRRIFDSLDPFTESDWW